MGLRPVSPRAGCSWHQAVPNMRHIMRSKSRGFATELQKSLPRASPESAVTALSARKVPVRDTDFCGILPSLKNYIKKTPKNPKKHLTS